MNSIRGEMDVRKTTRAARFTCCVAAATILAGAPLTQAWAEVITPGPTGPCALARTSGETVQDYSTRVITCAADMWTVPGGADRAVCIATRESGLDPRASSPNGDYLGLFQHSAKYWPARYDEWTKTAWNLRRSAFSARTNAIVTIRMVHGIGSWATAGWPTTGC